MKMRQRLLCFSMFLIVGLCWTSGVVRAQDQPVATDTAHKLPSRTSPLEALPGSLPEHQEAPEELRSTIEQPPFLPEAMPGTNDHEQAAVSEVILEVPHAAEADRTIIDHLQIKEMDISDVLKLLSQKSGLNIIAGRDVKGSVSMYVKDVKLNDALRIILDANDLAYHEEDGIIRVMTASAYQQRYGQVFGSRRQTKMVRVTHARVEDVSPLLEQIKSPSGRIVSDETSKIFVLMDTEEKITMMMDVLREIDCPLDVEVFVLNYAPAKTLVDQIVAVLSKGIGSMTYDERSNTIVVSDVPDKIAAVRRIVAAFDVKDQQVLIEAKIVQIKLTDAFEMGVNWQRVFSDIDQWTAQLDFDVIDSAEPNKAVMTIGTLAAHHYTAMVEALRKIGETNILSSPSVIALNRQEARILVGSTQPYVTTTTTTTASGPTITAEHVNFIDVGVKLYVTPTIHQDGFITLKIRPEVSSVLDTLTTSENNTIPIVETSEVETMVRIKNGETIVIGGLIKDEHVDMSRKVPVLGDVPVLGAAFRSRSAVKTKTEIAIFLTPRIVSGLEYNRGKQSRHKGRE